MASVFNAVCISAAMTAIYVFRFRDDTTTRKNIRYFLLFIVVEWLAEHYLVGGDALNVDVGIVALLIAGLFLAAGFVRGRLDEPEERDGRLRGE